MDAGLTRIETTSFVHPKLVPQMADAEDVMTAVKRRRGVSLAGLILNRRGYDRAVEAGIDEINYVVVATETFSERNQGMTTHDAVMAWEEISSHAADQGLRRTVTIGASFGCPFEGEVPVERITKIAERLYELGVEELCLGRRWARTRWGCCPVPECSRRAKGPDVASDTSRGAIPIVVRHGRSGHEDSHRTDLLDGQRTYARVRGEL